MGACNGRKQYIRKSKTEENVLTNGQQNCMEVLSMEDL